ncbi:sensor histidine kinase [Mariniflexile jejuense]|uniref:Sensor histidine kinase n=1 Tax=Mariniflexile jejuense TaxID=1173582 RepID=A0ABW3JDZ6_9FLAO
MSLLKNRQLVINIFIGLGLISIPFLSSPDLSNGWQMLQVKGFQKSLFSYTLLLLFFYTNYYLIIPKFYITKRWIVLTTTVIVSYLIILKLPDLILGSHPKLPFNPRISNSPSNLPPYLPKRNEIPFFNLFDKEHYLYQFLGVFSLSLFLRTHEHLNDVKNEKLTTEVSYLKAQINPHFLFNTLNSIYALALTKSDKTPNAILKLSDLMRHVVTESHQNNISLQKEINYIQNFIDLQKLRLTERTKLTTIFTGNFKKYQIAPLILISVIENAFKYGVSSEDASEINLSLSVNKNNLLTLNVENTIVVKSNKNNSTEEGIKNTKKQLNIFYPNKHVLRIKTDKNTYNINLTIQLE